MREGRETRCLSGDGREGGKAECRQVAGADDRIHFLRAGEVRQGGDLRRSIGETSSSSSKQIRSPDEPFAEPIAERDLRQRETEVRICEMQYANRIQSPCPPADVGLSCLR